VPTTDGLLYDDEWNQIESRHPERFRRTYAISREHTKADGGKVYVQDRMAEHAAELFERLDRGAHIYFCGLKGMMPGILSTLQACACACACVCTAMRTPCTAMHIPLQEVAEAKGISWETQLETLKKNGQWHVEVY
jgi:ferredoxin--NADP+ reductase